MKVSGGASCQSSAWRVRSFMALWWLLGLCGPGPVFELPRLCGQHGGHEWRARGACRGVRAAAAPHDSLCSNALRS